MESAPDIEFINSKDKIIKNFDEGLSAYRQQKFISALRLFIRSWNFYHQWTTDVRKKNNSLLEKIIQSVLVCCLAIAQHHEILKLKRTHGLREIAIAILQNQRLEDYHQLFTLLLGVLNAPIESKGKYQISKAGLSHHRLLVDSSLSPTLASDSKYKTIKSEVLNSFSIAHYSESKNLLDEESELSARVYGDSKEFCTDDFSFVYLASVDEAIRRFCHQKKWTEIILLVEGFFKLAEMQMFPCLVSNYKLILANAYLQQKDYQKSIDILNELTVTNPQYPESYSLLIDCYSKLGDWEAAENTMITFLEKFPTHYRFHVTFHNTFKDIINRHQNKKQLFDELHQAFKWKSSDLKNMATGLKLAATSMLIEDEKNDTGESYLFTVKILNRLDELDNSFLPAQLFLVEVFESLAQKFFSTKIYLRLITHLKKSCELLPHDTMLQYFLAKYLFIIGNRKESYKLILKLMVIEPENSKFKELYSKHFAEKPKPKYTLCNCLSAAAQRFFKRIGIQKVPKSTEKVEEKASPFTRNP